MYLAHFSMSINSLQSTTIKSVQFKRDYNNVIWANVVIWVTCDLTSAAVSLIFVLMMKLIVIGFKSQVSRLLIFLAVFKKRHQNKIIANVFSHCDSRRQDNDACYVMLNHMSLCLIGKTFTGSIMTFAWLKWV